MEIYSRLRFGMTPEINAAVTTILGIFRHPRAAKHVVFAESLIFSMRGTEFSVQLRRRYETLWRPLPPPMP